MFTVISIHTPAKGATAIIQGKQLVEQISIHTPAKGATKLYINFTYARGDFNPHSREGSDYIVANKDKESVNFNPHSREGSDCAVVIISILREISIHTPAKGATTPDVFGGIYLSEISIHTPAKGATINYTNLLALLKFQSTLPRRERLQY